MNNPLTRCLSALFCLLAFALPAKASSELPPEILRAFAGEAWAGYAIPGSGMAEEPLPAHYTPRPASYYHDEHGVAEAIAVLKKGDENILCLLEKPGGTDWQVVAECPGILLQGDIIPVIEGESYRKFDLLYMHKPGYPFLNIEIKRVGTQWRVTCVSANPYTPQGVNLPIRMPGGVDHLVFYLHDLAVYYGSPALDYRNVRIDGDYPNAAETFDTLEFLTHADELVN
jgi:hypothetical protein